MEEEIIKSEEKYRAIIENAPEFIFMFDENLKLLSVNKSGAEVLKRNAEDMIGKSLFDVFPKDYAEKHAAALQKVFKTGEKYTGESTTMVGGKKINVHVALSPIKDSAGKVTAVVGMSREITKK